MAHRARILAFAGSTRGDSVNKKLVRVAAAAAVKAGAEVTVVDLRDLALPLFDEDLEAASGPPAGAVRLKKMMVECDGFLIASPEYNSSVTAALKNAIDWASRPAPGEAPLVAFRGKAAALMSASPGALGGLRGLVHLRAILGNIGVLVMPDQVAVPSAFESFAADGSMKDEKQRAKVEQLARDLVALITRLRS
ncbi:MAG: NAD(P)H-dependent oxidoreductase [Phycisphaerales bacterium]|nr:NAD(P)H-dependent oxidoreductase [Phycisphaerales bacterium]